MCYNSFDLEENWKMRVARAERKSVLAYQTRDLQSPEAQLLERLLCGVRRLFTKRLLQSFQPLRYSVQQE